MTAPRYSATVIPYISMTDVVTINGDPKGTEYLIVKKNRVKYIIRNLTDGLDYNCNFERLTPTRKATDAELDSLIVKADPLIRMGAMATATSTHGKWKYAKDQLFVILNVKDDRVRIIEKGGNEMNSYWTLPITAVTVVP